MIFSKIKLQLRQAYDNLAKFWGEDFTLHDWGYKELQEFAKLVKENGGSKVLDCGCGSGVQSKVLFETGLEVVGLDLSPKMVSEAKKSVPEAKFVVGDMTMLDQRLYPEPIRSEHHGRRLAEGFDGVYARASLLHIPKKLIPKVLKSIRKILTNDGIFYLALKEGEGESEVEEERYGKRIRRFFSFFKTTEIKKLLSQSGFKIVFLVRHKRHVTSQPWLQVLARKL